jgi:hypothetical protein
MVSALPEDAIRVNAKAATILRIGRSWRLIHHREKQSDEAIQSLLRKALDCFAEFIIGRRFAPTRWLA